MYSVKINRFDGGLNLKDTPVNGALNQSPDCQNVDFDDLGAVKTRNGYSALVSAGIHASWPVDLLHSYKKDDGTSQMLAICGDTFWRASGNTFVTVESGQSVFTHEVPVQAFNYQNQMFMSNGYANPYKWNGTNFTHWGISAPSAATAAIDSAGTLTGSYRYVILGVNSNSAKGNYGSHTTEVTAVSQKIYLTEIPVFPASAGVNNKAICRNTAAASGVYYIITQIANTTTVYQDNNSDSVLDSGDLAPTDNAPPPYFTVMAVHNQRVFGASSTGSYPTRLYFSYLNEPELFSSLSLSVDTAGANAGYLRIGDGDGYPIRGLAVLSNGIVIAKNDGAGNGSMWFLYMPDTNPVNWSQIKLDTQSGGQSARTMVNFGNYIMYLNRFGVFDLNEQAMGAIRSDALSHNIEDEIFTLASNYLSAATAINWKNRLWISVPYGATQQTNNRVLLYDYVRERGTTAREAGAWARWTNMKFSCFTIHGGYLYAGSANTDGYVYKLDTSTADNGTAIDSYYTTMGISGKDEHKYYTKQWRQVHVTVEASGSWDMQLYYINDFNDESGNVENIDLSNGATLWGTAVWGTDKWGAAILRKRVSITLSNSVSKTIQLKFRTNVANQYFKVHEVEVFYNLCGLR